MEMGNTYKTLVEKSERRRPLGRGGRRENNINMDLKETRLEYVDWIHLAQMAGSCEHGNEPSGSIKDGDLTS
jgi:hypothetical protein